MDEYVTQSDLCLVGQVSKNKLNQYLVLKFEVWLNNYDYDIDIDITDKLSVEQLDSLKAEFLKQHEEEIENKREENMTDFEREQERLEAEGDRQMDEAKAEGLI